MIISGKELAARMKSEMAEQVATFPEKYGRVPHLVVILVGDDPASVSYVTGKAKASEVVGIRNTTIRRPETITEDELLSLIRQLNEDDSVDGILVQLPLPKHISEAKVIETISKEKDVDGFHPLNVAALWQKQPCTVACTPKGIIKLLKAAGVSIQGKRAVVVGRSNIVQASAGRECDSHGCPQPYSQSAGTYKAGRDPGRGYREAEVYHWRYGVRRDCRYRCGCQPRSRDRQAVRGCRFRCRRAEGFCDNPCPWRSRTDDDLLSYGEHDRMFPPTSFMMTPYDGIQAARRCAACSVIRAGYYFKVRPSEKALPTFSPIARYALLTGSKVTGRSLAGSILPSSSRILSSAHTLMIFPTRWHVSGS